MNVSLPTLKREKEYGRPKDFKASVERSERVTRRRKVAIEQQKQEATKKRKLLEQSGDRICDLHFESGASTSETTEEQLTDGMDTDNSCDGQRAKSSLSHCKLESSLTFSVSLSIAERWPLIPLTSITCSEACSMYIHITV
ncbi:hypothetical protein P5673_018869 [Acropora cervicornis]|uniref:Uncharacterized protein n=1 Tax=Acropora cervicornis TaxID=6130 RepID=A0AAD9QD41_ACRCE|nr:hypothetical protein P5673_018869 [Acropora cervicornis]